MQRRRVEIVRIRVGDAPHRLGVRLVLIDALLGIELLDVAHRHRVDERALFRGARLSFSASAF